MENGRHASQRIAVIDLGSNTARLIVMQSIPGYVYRLEDEIREVVRLRQGMTARGMTDEAMKRAFFALRLFKRFCDGMEVDTIIPTATSAGRRLAAFRLAGSRRYNGTHDRFYAPPRRRQTIPQVGRR